MRDADGGVLERAAETVLAVAQGLLGPLEVVDVGVRADPLADLAAAVEHRHGPDHYLAVDAVVASQAVLHQVEDLVLDGVGPGGSRVVPIVGMHRIEPAPAPQLLASLAGEGAPVGLVGDRLQEGQFLGTEGGAGPRAERQCAEQLAVRDQGMAGIGLDAHGADEARPQVIHVLNVLDDDPLPRLRDTAADGLAEREPLEAASAVIADAACRVQPKPALVRVEQVIEEDMAVEVVQDLLADVLDGLPGILAVQ